MAIKEPNWLTPENMQAYIEHLDKIDEMIEAQIEAHIEAKHTCDNCKSHNGDLMRDEMSIDTEGREWA